jgi:hypothetical protein
MKKKIQITAIVKEDSVNVKYETAKHDSISLAEKDLYWMMETTKASGSVASVQLVKTIYNIVECYKDQMELKYA